MTTQLPAFGIKVKIPQKASAELQPSINKKVKTISFSAEKLISHFSLDNEHDRVDLVFYHRILRCHVLIDLKVRKFKHADAGQMNFYLNYFRKNIMAESDNPPVGLILCADRDWTENIIRERRLRYQREL